MVNIKNVNPLKSALNVLGQNVEYGGIIDVPRDVADELMKSPNFEKASLEDAKKTKAAKEKK